MRAMEIWQNQSGEPATGLADAEHLADDVLYSLAQPVGMQAASAQELAHLSLCPRCFASWVEWQESLQIVNITEFEPSGVMTYGLLKAAGTDLKESLRLESACGQFILTLFPETSSPGHALITLEINEPAQGVVVEGQHVVVRDGNGLIIVSGTMRDGRLAGRHDNLNTIKLDSWTLVSVPHQTDTEE